MEKYKKLKPKEELFCQYYAKSGQAFGNITRAYALSFGKDFTNKKQARVCQTLGARLLGKVGILKRCDKLMQELIDDATADAELDYVIKQRENLHAKVSAIGERNKLRGRITEKHKHQFEGVADEALAEKLAEGIARITGDNRGAGNAAEGEQG